MNIKIFILMVFCFQLFYWFIGRRASKDLKGQQDYFLAGKSVQFFPLMMTFFATQVGGGIILGSADEAYKFGWAVLFYPLGSALGLILLGCGIGRRLAELPISTTAQIFEVVYGSRLLKKVASLLSILSLFMILVAQIIASHKFLISLGVDNTLLFIFFWLIVIFYTIQGGLKAVISTDIVQATIFSLIFLLSFISVFYFSPANVSIPSLHLESFISLSSKLSGWLLMPLFFMILEQDMGQRCFSGASPKIVSKASLVAGICTMGICIIPVFFGCLGKTMGIEAQQKSSVLMDVITRTTTPAITALVGCAVLAAIISTATSLMNAISSNLSNDFNIPAFKKIPPMQIMKSLTGLISFGALFFAFYFNNIVNVLIQSYELSVSCLFVSIAMALLRRKGHFLSALISIILGGLGFCLFRVYPLEFPKEIASIVLSACGYLIGEITVHSFRKTEINRIQ